MKDLTGQRFGKWTVIKFDHRKGKSYYWLCRCECGKESIVRADGLINGRSKSCGCSKESAELTQGKRFGALVVIRKTNELYKDGSYLYECRYDCGNTIKTTSSRLKNDHIQSCGCGRYQIDDLTGKKFNHLTVTGFSHSDGQKVYWNCLCDCGKTAVVRSDYLKNGNTTSCGCAAQEKLEAGRKELKKTFVDGTNIKQIVYKRKLNSNNKTGIKGVSFIASRQKYRTQITIKRKVINLGEFDKLEDAAEARKKGEDMYFAPMLEDNDK